MKGNATPPTPLSLEAAARWGASRLREGCYVHLLGTLWLQLTSTSRNVQATFERGLSAAWYISNLLERRADLAESERDADAAAADRALAATMREKRAPAPAAVK